eukprot:TRINITY_DN5859_c0_g1_i3.p1 TRINITY_DN5859_c0_g1~~TRINITY_DN5859_c0_g1_i3.p1  ORF type:complete len:220 (+),score=83.42 TRINITY_DN5859_c0_g1_i3:100-759(+)
MKLAVASLAALLLVLCTLPSARAVTLQVEPKTTECFYHHFEADKGAKFFWQVVRGGLLDVLVQVKYEGVHSSAATLGRVIFEKMHFEGEEEGFYEFRSGEAGIYSFCFNNEMARFTAKVVRFKIIASAEWGTDVKGTDDEGAPKSQIEMSARRISEEMDLLELHQQYMRQREIRHRLTAESTNSRVLWLSVLECATLITISCLQVYFIRSLFNKQHISV